MGVEGIEPHAVLCTGLTAHNLGWHFGGVFSISNTTVFNTGCGTSSWMTFRGNGISGEFSAKLIHDVICTGRGAHHLGLCFGRSFYSFVGDVCDSHPGQRRSEAGHWEGGRGPGSQPFRVCPLPQPYFQYYHYHLAGLPWA